MGDKQKTNQNNKNNGNYSKKDYRKPRGGDTTKAAPNPQGNIGNKVQKQQPSSESKQGAKNAHGRPPPVKGSQQGRNNQAQQLQYRGSDPRRPTFASLVPQDIAQFCRGIQQNLRGKMVNTLLISKQDIMQWKASFGVAASGVPGMPEFYETLLRAYVTFPDSASYAPAADHVLRVVNSYLLGIVSRGGSVEDAVGLVCDVILERLTRSSSISTIVDKDQCIELAGILMSTMYATAGRAQPANIARLMTRVGSCQQLNTVLQNVEPSLSQSNATQKLVIGTTWTNGTIGWLISGSWLNYQTLEDSYDSVENYAKVLEQLWTMLTFYWGAAALWPKCHHRLHAAGGGKVENGSEFCGIPLMFRHRRPNTCSCVLKSSRGGTKTCGNPAQWGCFKHDHDSICDSCLLEKQRGLCGPPSKFESSTDLYDAEVNSVNIYGENVTIYAEGLMSRKPPQVAVNWKTSYRLQPSCLVCIAFVSFKGQALQQDDRIYWGEIVVHDKKQGDYGESNRRSKGLIDIRLLSRSDCPAIESDYDLPLHRGSKLVIIDCRVFTPEVVSVLATVCSPSFRNGLERITFSPALVGTGDLPAPFGVNLDQPIANIVHEATMRSQLRAIRDLNAASKAAFISKVSALAAVKTLDRTQSQAFAMGLGCDLHCTQGPPGTGKSYVGVCLVLAFTILRDVLRAEGKQVGPILTLSYKNHALDEFLTDAMAQSPSLQQHQALIRLGKPENTALLNHTERSSNAENAAQKELDKRLAVLKHGRILLQKWMNYTCSVANVLSAQQLMNCLRFGLQALATEFDFSLPVEAFESLREALDVEEGVIAFQLRDMKDTLLYEGSQHWKIISNVLILLQQWLLGECPPPRCEFLFSPDRRCLNYAADGVSYCYELHQCLSPQCGEHRFHPDIPFCDFHRCKSVTGMCNLQRLDDVEFCADHLCLVCVKKERDGPQACVEDRCAFRGCGNAKLSPYGFCLEHTCVICVRIDQVSESSVRVHFFQNRRRLLSNFCIGHKCQMDFCHQAQDELRGEFCREHRCFICFNQVDLSSRQAEQSLLCADHRCQFEDGEEICGKPRALAVVSAHGATAESAFCENHTCAVCIQTGVSLDMEVTAPFFTCLRHPTCQGISNDGYYCSNLAMQDNMYCPLHDEAEDAMRFEDSMNCCGIAKGTGKRCKAQRPPNVRGRWYCIAHKAQQEAEEAKSAKLKVPCIDSLVLRERLHFAALPREDQMANTLISTAATFHLHRCNECDTVGLAHACEDWKCRFHQYVDELRTTAAVNGAVFADIESDDDYLSTAIHEDGTNNGDAYPEKEGGFPLANHGTPAAPLAQRREKVAFFYEEEIPVVDGGRIGDNPDEWDAQGIDEEGEGGNEDLNENVEHRNAIYRAEDDDEYDDPNEYAEAAAFHAEAKNKKDPTVAVEEMLAWGWDSDRDERRDQARSFIEGMCAALAMTITSAEKYVDEARQRKNEATAMTLKKATLIGGTIVGAAKRLAALRAAEPFVIIVEEACEVMEPTLVAVLAVESVQKLELIGDHMQLPAFVNNCWFNLELSMPSIKTSLFERLVTSSPHLCTVLDVQRRMRTCIADLTRPEYAAVTRIQDHAATGSQKVGDRVIRSKLGTVPHRTLWHDHGRSIPGIQSCIYFWNMAQNSQSRPKAGLSACNENEGEAVVGLVNFLVTCGVPQPAITVITPYQGQKRVLIDLLRKAKLIPSRFDENEAKKSLVVSTVDRYQGDENDIVILTLVRTKPGNRFVTLPNRFIVAASRARLGFFIVGSTEAVVMTDERGKQQGASHWRRFMKALENTDPSGCDAVYEGLKRVGNELPICCPAHPASKKLVSSAKERRIFPTKDSWQSLCVEVCNAPLKCGHPCTLTCHCFSPDGHQNRCNVELERPCDAHRDMPLLCGDITLLPQHFIPSSITAAHLDETPVEKALRTTWKCDIEGDYRLPECPHQCRLTCGDHKDMQAGHKHWPECKERVHDFIHPRCGHRTRDMTCAKLRKLEKNPPLCMVKVEVQLPCGHRQQLLCHQNEHDSLQSIICNEAVQFPRPRCCHPISLRCFEAKKITTAWQAEGHNGAEEERGKTIVEQGTVYGPDESMLRIAGTRRALPPCNANTSFRLRCGHDLMVPCNRAFGMNSGIITVPPCESSVQTHCSLCKMDVIAPCHVSESLSGWQPEDMYLRAEGAHQFSFEESALQLVNPLREVMSLWKKMQALKCSTPVKIYRSCEADHFEVLTCAQVTALAMKTRQLTACRKQTLRAFPVCGHEVSVLCCDRNRELPPCKVRAVEDFIFANCGHHIKVGTCGELLKLRQNPTLVCSEQLSLFHNRCGHAVQIPCHARQLVEDCEVEGDRFLPNMSDQEFVVEHSGLYCTPCAEAPACEKLVSFHRECDHVMHNIVKCCDAFAWAAGSTDPPKCEDMVTMPHPLCDHEVKVPCSVSIIMTNWQPWSHEIPPPDVKFVENVGRVIHYPLPGGKLAPPAPVEVPQKHRFCSSKVFVHFDLCGHTASFQCYQVYSSSNPLKCRAKVPVACGRCNVVRELDCSAAQNLLQDQVDETCTNPVRKRCQVCQVNDVEVSCNALEVECHRDVIAMLPCGHEAKWKCGSIAAHEDVRVYHDDVTGINSRCLQCVVPMWNEDDDRVITLDVLRQEAAKMIQERMQDPNCIVEQQVLQVVKIDTYEKARSDLIDRLIQAFNRGKVQPFAPPSASDIIEYIHKNYELVCFFNAPGKAADIKNMNHRFASKRTQYGSGLQMTPLTRAAIEKHASSAGQAVAWVALAFRGRELQAKQPFQIGDGKEIERRANMTIKGYKDVDAYACVRLPTAAIAAPVPLGQAAAAAIEEEEVDVASNEDVVFWYPNAVVPLFIASIKLDSQCSICMNYFARDNKLGALCPSNHLVCWDCFGDYINAAKAVDAINFADTTGRLCCPDPACKKGYDSIRNAVHAPEAIMQALRDFEMQNLIRREVAVALEEEALRWKEELERIKLMSERDQELYHLKREICEEILNVRCPRCKVVFVDFDGCFALTCGNKTCRAGFCAWCQQDCGPDAHGHVPNCPEGNRNVYGDVNALKPTWNRIRVRKIRALLQNKSQAVRKEVLERIKKEVEDLGIKMTDLQAK